MKNVERKNTEMRNMGTRKAGGKKRFRVFWKGLAGAAAACMILVAAAGISNPVFARELFGHLFGRLAESSEGDKYEERDRSLFQKLEEYAQRIEGDREENGEKRSEADTDTQATENRAENGEKDGDRDGNKEKSENMEGQENLDFRQSVTDQGATLSVTDAYCDGYILYYTAVLETDNEEFTQADGIMLERPKDDPNNLTIDGNRDVNYVERAFTKEADGRYITAMQVNLMGLGADLEQSEGELVVDWRVGGFTGRRWDSWDEQGNYAKSGSLTGDWHLAFPVSIDISENQAFSIDKEENGILLKRGIITKAGLVLELELPDLTKEPYQLACSTEILVKDSNGERLQMLSEHEEPQEDGTAAKSLMVLYDGQKELSIEVIAKDEKGTVLATIPFILQ